MRFADKSRTRVGDEGAFEKMFSAHAEAATCSAVHQTNVHGHAKIPDSSPACIRRTGVSTSTQEFVHLFLLLPVVRAHGVRKVFL